MQTIAHDPSMTSQSTFRKRIATSFPSSKSGSHRPILNRPTSLPLSPTSKSPKDTLTFASSLNTLLLPAPSSPHVHFPPTPSIHITYSTHDATYDRSLIQVRPSSLVLPPRRERAYQSFAENFVASNRVPVDIPSIQSMSDTRRYEWPLSADAHSKPKPAILLSPQSSLASAHNKESFIAAPLSPYCYPRSPFPQSPLPSTPVWDEDSLDSPLSPGLKRAHRARSGSSPSARVTSSMSMSRAHTLSPYPFSDMAVYSSALELPLSPINEYGLPSSAVSGSFRAAKPPPLRLQSRHSDSEVSTGGESAGLSAAFWESVSVVDDDAQEEDPVLAFSLAMAPLNVDGSIRSPGLPVEKNTGTARSVYSPKGNALFLQDVNAKSRSFVASPSPSDPFASFPSFAATLSKMGGAAIELVNALNSPKFEMI